MSEDLVVRRATEADRPAWEAFVAARPEGDPLQTWAWGEVTAAHGERPVRLVSARPDGRLVGVAQALVRPAVAGRTVAYVAHGPLWEREAPDATAIVGALVDGLRRLGRDERSIVVKLDPRSAATDAAGSGVADELLARGLRPARRDLQVRATRIVELLDGGQQLAATWTSDARNLVGRSAREGVGVDVDRAGSAAAVAEFHALLEETAERAAFRPRSRDFLARLATGFAAASGPTYAAGPPATGWYTAIARWGGRPVAGMAVARVGDRAFYLYGASLREPQLKHVNAAYATMAAVMRALADDDVRWLDLWGVVEADDRTADPSWQGYSLFKRKFGGRSLRHPGTFDLVVDPLWYRLRDARERLRGG